MSGIDGAHTWPLGCVVGALILGGLRGWDRLWEHEAPDACVGRRLLFVGAREVSDCGKRYEWKNGFEVRTFVLADRTNMEVA